MAGKNTIVGFDIGRHSVKAVWAELRGESPFILRAEILRLPSDGGGDNANVIAPWIGKMGLAKASCVIALPGRLCMFQPFLLTPNDPRTLDQAAAMEVVKYNEMAAETMAYGTAPFSAASGEKRFLLAMARHSLLDQTLALVKNLDLSVIDIIPAPVAMFSALSPANTAPEPCLYVNIGHSGTEIAMGSSSGLMFARAFSIGGQMFTEAIMRQRKLTGAQAENLKVTEGTLAGNHPLAAVLQPAADMWISELKSALSVYDSLFPSARPVRMILTGGASQLPGFREHIAAKTDMPVSVPDPLPGATETVGKAPFIIAGGLASAGLEGHPPLLSLLPSNLKDELMFRQQKPYWLAAGTAAALILTVSLVGGFRHNHRMEQHLVVQEASLSRRHALAAEIEAIKARSELIREVGNRVKKVLSGTALIRELTQRVAELTAPGDWISAICDADLYFSDKPFPTKPTGKEQNVRTVTTTDKKKEEQPPEFNRIIVEGYTRVGNLSTVQDLIARLKELPFVEHADLLSDDKLPAEKVPERVVAQLGARRFVIDVRITSP